MPLARYSLYRQGPQIWVGANCRRTARAGSRRHAPHRDRVRRLRRLSASVHPALGIPRRTFPADLPDKDVFGNGWRGRSSSRGDGRRDRGAPSTARKGIVVADCDLPRPACTRKRFFDAVGHYGPRGEVLVSTATLTNLNGSPQAEAIPQPHENKRARYAHDLGPGRRAPARTAGAPADAASCLRQTAAPTPGREIPCARVACRRRVGPGA